MPPCRTLLPSSSRLTLSALSVRFASTTSLAEEISAVDSGIAETVFPPPTDPLLTDLDLFESASQAPVYTEYGFLKELGLDFGWGPTSVMQWSLEHVHIITGTPWWLSIILTMVVTRIIIFKTYLASADTSARIAVVNAHLKDTEARLKKAKAEKDTLKMMQSTQEMRTAYQLAGIKMWKGLAPFINIPFGYGMFRLLRNACSLPVPGLETGGTLWFYDLTSADPYFILPIVTGAGTYFMFKLGGETGARSIPGPILKIMQNALPIFSIVFTAYWPAGMQISMAFSSVMATAQSLLLRQGWFRRFWAIQPLLDSNNSPGSSSSEFKSMVIPTQARTVSSGPEEADAPKKSLLGTLTEKGRKFVKTHEQQPSGRRTYAEIEQAKRYEEKRRKEINQVKTQRRQQGQL
ncbi:MAG: hypothetical protein Q9212_007234 [Teloschistes hypoglaucus]